MNKDDDSSVKTLYKIVDGEVEASVIYRYT